MKLATFLAGAALLAMAGAAGAQPTLSKGDQKFVQTAAMGGMAEVAAGQVAAAKSTNDQVKQFASMIVDDHTKTNEQLKAIASVRGVILPDADPKADKETARLNKLSGAKFDKVYAKMQVRDHAGAVKAFEKEAAKGKDADLKKFAADTLPVLQAHADKAAQLASSVGVPPAPAKP